MTADDFERRQTQLLDEYRLRWLRALLLDDQRDLEASLLGEIATYLHCDDAKEVHRRCRGAVKAVADEWSSRVAAADPKSVERYYDQSETYIYDLMWWHSLVDDNGPLAYVVALDFARRHGCRDVLDFGAGVGGGGILFARHGFEVTLADISSTLLRFGRWRCDVRRLRARFIDLKTASLPPASFDLVTAMDVFEHLTDPVRAIDDIWRSLEPGGYLFGRLHGEVDTDHPQHIVVDFEPTLSRLRERGFVEVWRDEWLWGHRAFQRS